MSRTNPQVAWVEQLNELTYSYELGEHLSQEFQRVVEAIRSESLEEAAVFVETEGWKYRKLGHVADEIRKLGETESK